MRIEDLSDIEILGYLARGIDLYTGERLGNEHFLRNPSVISALYEGIIALQSSTNKVNKNNKNQHVKITPSILDQIERIEPYTTIKHISKNISNVIPITSGKLMKKIVDFLIEKGDITVKEDVNDNDKLKKFATELGEQHGLFNGTSTGKAGRTYHALCYNLDGQNYVISMLPEIFPN